MTDKYILDENGDPCECENLLEWGKWFETADRCVAVTFISKMAFLVWLGKRLKTKRFEPMKISTVFLGLNHSFDDNKPPLLYETMIFGGKHDQYQERYSTKEEALKGHDAAIAKAKGE